MKNLLFTIAFLFTATLSFAQSTVYVSGHTKSGLATKSWTINCEI